MKDINFGFSWAFISSNKSKKYPKEGKNKVLLIHSWILDIKLASPTSPSFRRSPHDALAWLSSFGRPCSPFQGTRVDSYSYANAIWQVSNDTTSVESFTDYLRVLEPARSCRTGELVISLPSGFITIVYRQRFQLKGNFRQYNNIHCSILFLRRPCRFCEQYQYMLYSLTPIQVHLVKRTACDGKDHGVVGEEVLV